MFYQRGQAMVEMVVISFVTLLLLFSIIQFALLYNAKTVLNYAAFEAARIGALNYSHPQSMRLALAQKLAILEPVDSDPNDTSYQKLVDQQTAFMSNFDSIACIRRINPPSSSSHWVGNQLAAQTSSSILNDHLIHRDATPLGDPLQSIQDANLLKISVTYCPKMIVPIVSTAIKRLMLVAYHDSDPDPIDGWEVTVDPISFHKQCYENDRFPMVAQALVRMHTPAGKYGYSDTDCEELTSLSQQLGP